MNKLFGRTKAKEPPVTLNDTITKVHSLGALDI
jgi:hypothetical protein